MGIERTLNEDKQERVRLTMLGMAVLMEKYQTTFECRFMDGESDGTGRVAVLVVCDEDSTEPARVLH